MLIVFTIYFIALFILIHFLAMQHFIAQFILIY